MELTPNSINEGWVAHCITGSRRKPNPIVLLNSQVNRQLPKFFTLHPGSVHLSTSSVSLSESFFFIIGEETRDTQLLSVKSLRDHGVSSSN